MSAIAFHEKAGRSQVDSCLLLGQVFLFPPSGHCRHASIRTLCERSFARCMLGVLGSAGAAICLAPYDSALGELNLGQAIDAVTGTRLGLLSFLFLGNDFVFMRLGELQLHSCCAMARTLLHSPTGDAATLPAFSRSQR